MFLISFHLRSINLIRVCLVFLGLLWLGALAVRATPYYVETNGNDGGAGTSWATAKKTIQAGVNVASGSDDTVWVSNGTYTLTAQISLNKAITLQSFKGRDLTFINGNYPNTINGCIYISTNAVVSGFTISNGCYGNGGAVAMYYTPNYSQMILTNCVITGSRATNADTQGGGIWCVGANTLIVDCVVTGNTSAQYGGGVMLYYGAMKNCIIINNSATNNGGGVYAQFGSVISNCEIIGNSGSSGSGIELTSYSVADSCVIASNQRSVAIQLANSSGGQPCVLKNSVIKYNLAGGVKVNSGSIVQNCLITRNSGGTPIELASVQTYTGYVANCTIVSNQNWCTMVISGPGTDTVFNCIIATNQGGLYAVDGTTNAFRYCCAPGWGSVFRPDQGNITTDPRFIDGIPGHENNWRLANNSPCINTGTNMNWMTNSFDLDGRARIRYGRVDIGAYELINEATLYGFR